jgi:transcription elongation factor Elf1
MSFKMDKFLTKEFEYRRSGTEIYFNCPFCNDKGWNYWFDTHKKFIHKKTHKEYIGLGRCFKCEKHHSVLSFLMEYKKLDLFAALSMIEGDKELTIGSILKKIESLDSDKTTSMDDLLK